MANNISRFAGRNQRIVGSDGVEREIELIRRPDSFDRTGTTFMTPTEGMAGQINMTNAVISNAFTITNLEFQNTVNIPNTGGTVALRITGDGGAAWRLAYTGGLTGDTTGFIPDGSDFQDVTVTVPANPNAAVTTRGATLTVGVSDPPTEISEGRTSISDTVDQAASLAHGLSSNYSGPGRGINLGFIDPDNLPFTAGSFTITGLNSAYTVTASGPAQVTVSGTRVTYIVTGGGNRGNGGGVIITRPGYTTFSQRWFEWGIG